MTFKHIMNIARVFLVLLTVGLILLLSFIIYAPGYIENYVLPDMAGDTGLKIISVRVRNIGFKGAELSDIRIGKDQKESFIIDSLRIDYSLSGILKKTIDRITLGGLSITVKYQNGRLSVSGLDTLANKNGKKEAAFLNSPLK